MPSLYSLSRWMKSQLPPSLLTVARTAGLARAAGRFYDEGELERAYQCTLAEALQQSPGWEERLKEYWQRWRFLDRMQALVRPDAQAPIVDVGCGLLSVLRFLPGLRVGVDVHADLYRRLLPWPEGIELRTGSAQHLPLPSGWARLVICTNALDHMVDPEQAVLELARILQPGGVLLIAVEVFDQGGSPLDRGAAHPHSFTQKEARALFSRVATLQEEHLHPWTGLKEVLLGTQEPLEASPRREWVGLGVRER